MSLYLCCGLTFSMKCFTFLPYIICMDMIMEAQISHLIGDDQTPAQPTTSTEKWNTIAIFPPTMMRKEINMEGWRICSGKKKYVRAISWEEGRNNFGHVYVLTAIDWLLSNKTIIDGKIIIFMCYQAGCLSINVWWNHYIFSSQLYRHWIDPVEGTDMALMVNEFVVA